MTIYCSKKLETFLGQITTSHPQPSPSILGDWNGHLFTIDRKKCLIVMNNKTCYSVFMFNVYKKDCLDFGRVFRERLIKQLHTDFTLSEATEVKLRQVLSPIDLQESNNDRKILGTINHHIENLKFYKYQDGGVDYWDEVEVTGYFNRHLLGTKLSSDRKRNRNFFKPIDLMNELMQEVIEKQT
jgi:hypothetical protein